VLIAGSIAIAAVIAWIGLSGSDDSTLSISNPGGFPEVIPASQAAHVQEAAAYGETAVDATILPPHVVESIIFGEMEPPTS
jgi:hypothetical protein